VAEDHVLVQWRGFVLSVSSLLNLLPTLCLSGLIVPVELVKHYVKELQVSNLGRDTAYLDWFFLFFSFTPAEEQNIILKWTTADSFEILITHNLRLY
jgi:hypothetical protein